MTLKSFICLVFICIGMHVKAQIFPARQYTTRDELANSNVYDICHDDRGYLWFATERGVSRFDGYKFTNYLFKEGLDGAIVFSLSKDARGNILAATKFDGAFKMSGNFNKIIEEDLLLANEQTVLAGKYFYSLKDGVRVAVYQMGNNKTSVLSFPGGAKPYFILQKDSSAVYIGTSSGVFISKNGKTPERVFPEINEPVHSLAIRGNTVFVGLQGAVYAIADNAVSVAALVPDGGKVKRLMVDDNNRIWCATFPENRLYMFDKNTAIDISQKLNIAGISVNKILEDNEGNVWIATYGKGVFCLHHMYCTNYTSYDGLKNEYITSLLPIEHELLIGTYNGLFGNTNNQITPLKSFNNELEFIRKLDIHDDLIIATVSGISADKVLIKRSTIGNHPLQYVHATTTFIDGNYIYYSRWDKKVWRAPINGTEIGDAEVVFEDKEGEWTRVNAIFRDPQNKLWVGTTRGVYIISANNSWVRNDTGFLRTNITAFALDHDGSVLLGTDKGLVRYKDGKWIASHEINGKNLENITGLVHDNNDRIWISTLNGLFLMAENELIQFDARNTLLSDEINALAYDASENAIWVGTSFGLSRIDVGLFDKAVVIAPAAIFKTLRAADSIYRDLGINGRLELPYTSKNLSVRFSAIQFAAPEGIKFFYKFDDGPWEPTTGRQIEFASIPYGEHTIQLKSVGERGVEGPVANLTILVTTPIWATAWFKLLIGLTIAGIAYFLLRKRFEIQRKKQQERLELQSKVAELRHQALAASMNPHFIFNALNSIQHFINSHNTEEATDYLGKFARLIRMMLDYGGRTFIPLKDELERLEYYLELEKVRFGEKLNYSIEVDDSLRNNPLEIPNMVIQPVVENALWHGLLPANRNGHLLVKFAQRDNVIFVTVDDDGIGIIESKRRKKSSHNSLGIQMIRERLELLNRLSGYVAEIEIKDKSEINADKEGTIAQIVMGGKKEQQ
ncbi:MAG TPA: two-component regulator propeller domain-containing protein [Chitinophagales bacterium]|nr:two-component regulator propeller domain-containing protein [Chitinophagales bacterium]HNM28674.1 two-component regulator propeller domain-containing protein [Chitinophagales bacterium]